MIDLAASAESLEVEKPGTVSDEEVSTAALDVMVGDQDTLELGNDDGALALVNGPTLGVSEKSGVRGKALGKPMDGAVGYTLGSGIELDGAPFIVGICRTEVLAYEVGKAGKAEDEASVDALESDSGEAGQSETSEQRNISACNSGVLPSQVG